MIYTNPVESLPFQTGSHWESTTLRFEYHPSDGAHPCCSQAKPAKSGAQYSGKQNTHGHV